MQQKEDYDANRSHRNGTLSEIYTSSDGKSDLNAAVAVENDVILAVAVYSTVFFRKYTRHFMGINDEIIYKCQHSIESVMLQPF